MQATLLHPVNPVRVASTYKSGRQSASKVTRPRVLKCTASAQQHEASSSLRTVVGKFMMGMAAAAMVSVPVLSLPSEYMPVAQAGLVASDPIKNAKALLRYALPIDNKPIRKIQGALEGISESLRIPGSKSLGPISKAVRESSSTLGSNKDKIIAAFAPDKKAAGLAAIASLESALSEFQALIEAKDKQAVPIQQQKALDCVGAIEEAMVQGFPYAVPSEYDNLPQLKGRATLEMQVVLKEARENNVSDGKLTIVLDGYNAPVSAGNFLDLVLKGFYDSTEVQRADGFVVQFGDPEGPAEGYVDPATDAIRRIPFEVMVRGDKVPVYEETLEDLGRFNEQPVLPFNAYGTLAVARAEFEVNSGSSQMFFLLKESELTPTGSNLLDGRYAVFGYITDNQNFLQDLQVGDAITYIKVLDGAQNLVQPKQ